MKILITIAVVTFGALFTNNEAATIMDTLVSTSISSNPKALVKLKVKFGRKSLDCTKLGVCTFEAGGTLSPIDIDLSVVEPNGAKGTASMVNDKLVVNFAKSSMSREVIAKHFSNDQFVVEEAYKIELENTLVSSYNIRKGTYDVTNNGKFLTVEF